MGKSFGPNGLKLLKNWEGLRLSVYKDAAGLPTIGYGHLIREGEKFTTITEDQAECLLLEDVASAVAQLNSTPGVSKLNQNQFDALVCLIFNIGAQAWRTSSARRYVASGLLEYVPERMSAWNKITVNGKLKVCEGLINRRRAEIDLFRRKVA